MRDFKSVSEFLKTLTWQKIIQTFVFISIIISAWIFWDNRNVIYNSIRINATIETNAPFIIQLSSYTKSYLEEVAVKKQDYIAAIQVLNVNFRKNIKDTAFFMFNNKTMEEEYKRYLSSKIADIPLFSDNELNNQRIINIINGEFSCYTFKDSQESKMYPRSSNDILTVCSISIPPYYGRFTGYLSVYITKTLTEDDMIEIRQLLRDISLKIFETDVDKHLRAAKF